MFVLRFFCCFKQIGGKDIENLFENMMLRKKKLQKDIDLKRHLFTPFYLKMG